MSECCEHCVNNRFDLLDDLGVVRDDLEALQQRAEAAERRVTELIDAHARQTVAKQDAQAALADQAEKIRLLRDALKECYRVALHLQDKGTTQKRAISQIITIVDIALAGAEPAAIASGEPAFRHPSATYGCERCGRWDGMDASLDHDVWARIAATRDGEPWRILCLWCCDEIAVEIGIAENTPVRLYFPGLRLSSVLPEGDRDPPPERRETERA